MSLHLLQYFISLERQVQILLADRSVRSVIWRRHASTSIEWEERNSKRRL